MNNYSKCAASSIIIAYSLWKVVLVNIIINKISLIKQNELIQLNISNIQLKKKKWSNLINIFYKNELVFL